MTNTGQKYRQSLLAAYRILDTPPEQGFDDIATIAAQVCDTPAALVSLVEHERQWFKARVGFTPSETPIEQSICAHDLDRPGILEIRDLTADSRTAGNVLVTGEPHARFYAGAPLVTQDGTAIGRLCVIDTTPRPGGLSDGQRRSLEALARLAMTQLDLRGAAQAGGDDAAVLRSEGARSRAAHRAGRIGMFEVDVPSGETIVSEEFCEVFGLPIAQTYHVDALEALIVNEDRDQVSNRRTRTEGNAPSDVEYRIRRFNDGALRWIARRAKFTHDDDGRIVLMHGTVHDVTSRREAEAQQSVLNQEISHRLKNTLAMVQAIAMQTLRVVPDREPIDAFERRLLALSTAHDILLQDDWRSAELGAAAAAVIAQLGLDERIARSGPPVRLGPRAALSFALLIHELASNAMKYGALSTMAGRVTLDWQVHGQDITVRWQETGGPAVTSPTRKGFGSRLIRAGLVGTGGVDLRYDPHGLSVAMHATLDELGRS